MEKHTADLYQAKKGWDTDTQTPIHIPKGSPYLRQLHAQWRLRAIQSLDREEGIHFSSGISLSGESVTRIRERLLALLAEVKEEVAESPPETVHCLNVDFFMLLRDEE